MAVIDLAFGLQGTTIPSDHGYALYSAICRTLQLTDTSRLGVRVPTDLIPSA